jgi:hypothetical protein
MPLAGALIAMSTFGSAHGQMLCISQRIIITRVASFVSFDRRSTSKA